MFTVLGLYVRDFGGWVSVRRLIELMSALGIDPQSVRSSVSRLKKRGILVGERREGAAGYALSDYGTSILVEGDRRIFSREEQHASDWVLAVFSVPESERDKRHALRARLSWLGFATISSGTWVAPAHVASDAQLVLARDGLDHYVQLFHADHIGFADLRTLVGQWWDLDSIDRRYRDFIATYQPLLERWQGETGALLRDEEAFADYVRVLTSWRQLPYLDPGLPSTLVPADWAGDAAGHLFHALQGVLEGRAYRYAQGGTQTDS